MPETLEILRRRLERERQARKQAEQISEDKSRELFLKNQELSRLAEAEKNARLEVERLSLTDPLTSLSNRRHFDQVAGLEFSRAERYRLSLAAIMMDLDHFKRINDGYGHAAGDRVLVEAAAASQKILRVVDLGARIGGEEFCFLLPETGLEGGRRLAERLRAAVAGLRFQLDGEPLIVTASFGLAERKHESDSLADLLARADQTLYRAKNEGRNRVCSF